MEWYFVLLLMIGGVVALMATGMPIAIAFMFVCMVAGFQYWGGLGGIQQLVMSFFSAVTNFAFLPVPLFMLMGNVIFESGAGANLVDAVDKILGRLPGRLSIVCIGAGVLLGTMIGLSGGSISILGQTMLPEMIKRGYKNAVTLGPIVITGTLAALIPPSSIAVLYGAIARVSIGELLIAILIPGLLVGLLCTAYIIIRCVLQPSLSPAYEIKLVPLKEKLNSITRHILPVGIVIFAVMGSVFMGIATPSEAAALGAISCYILAAINKNLTWQMIKKSAMSTVQLTVMVLFIVVASISFSRLLASSGAVASLANFAVSLPVHPIVILIITQVIVLILGCFIDPASIIMITAPLFVPIMSTLGFDVLWYSVLMIINLQLGLITPPFGLDVYTMKAITPSGITIGDIFKSSMPYCALGYLVMLLVFFFPPLTTWLPSIMAK